MRPAPHAAAPVRSGRPGALLRVLVLLLVLVVPCTHPTARAAPVTPVAGAAAGGAGGTAGEHDHLDTALRGPGRSGRRAAAARPAPPSFTRGRRRVPQRLDARTGRTAGLPRGPRSVVLRC
ncbi:putative secreted protein [Streptomyces sp. KO7888]|uniref:hypothetical protein n=1 Tax=Streptomyces sp. KO7888 TaxID=2602737 RepID=UPI0013F6063E|nr:hypothetical protein [Streptomyces sp. KO7888]NHI08632.1 putative secreted protein [Streptomyces sp. KO7888]